MALDHPNTIQRTEIICFNALKRRSPSPARRPPLCRAPRSNPARRPARGRLPTPAPPPGPPRPPPAPPPPGSGGAAAAAPASRSASGLRERRSSRAGLLLRLRPPGAPQQPRRPPAPPPASRGIWIWRGAWLGGRVQPDLRRRPALRRLRAQAAAAGMRAGSGLRLPTPRRAPPAGSADARMLRICLGAGPAASLLPPWSHLRATGAAQCLSKEGRRPSAPSLEDQCRPPHIAPAGSRGERRP